MIWLALTGILGLAVSRSREEQALKKDLHMEGDKTSAANDITNLLYNPSRLWKENLKVGNWAYSTPVHKPPTTGFYFKKPTPELSGTVDWYHEGSQLFRTRDFRDQYVDNYRNAWSTETAQATRTQLVDGFQHEIITKGRTLTQQSRATGTWNPHGPNLYAWFN